MKRPNYRGAGDVPSSLPSPSPLFLCTKLMSLLKRDMPEHAGGDQGLSKQKKIVKDRHIAKMVAQD